MNNFRKSIVFTIFDIRNDYDAIILYIEFSNVTFFEMLISLEPLNIDTWYSSNFCDLLRSYNYAGK